MNKKIINELTKLGATDKEITTYGVLLELHKSKPPVKSQHLQKELGIKKPTMIARLRKMVDKGIIQRFGYLYVPLIK